MGEHDIFWPRFEPYVRRARRLAVLEATLSGCAWAAPAFCLAWSSARYLFGVGPAGMWVAVAAAGLVGLLRLLWGLRRLPGASETALACDRALEGKECVLTALHLRADLTSPFAREVTADASTVLARGEGAVVFPFSCRRVLTWTTGLWLVTLLLVLFGPAPDRGPSQRGARISAEAARDEAERLNESARRIEQGSLNRPAMRVIARRLRQEALLLQREASQGGPPRDEALERLTKLSDDIERQARRQGQAGQCAGAMVNQLASSIETQELADAMARGDWTSAEEAAGELGEGGANQAASAAEALGKAGEAMQAYMNSFVDDEEGAQERRELDLAYHDLKELLKKMDPKRRASVQAAAAGAVRAGRVLRYTDLDAQALRDLAAALRRGRCTMCGGGGGALVVDLPAGVAGRGQGRSRGRGRGKGTGPGTGSGTSTTRTQGGGPGGSRGVSGKGGGDGQAELGRATSLKVPLRRNERAHALTIIEKIRVAPSASSPKKEGDVSQTLGTYRREADRVLSRRSVPPAHRAMVGRYFDELNALGGAKKKRKDR